MRDLVTEDTWNEQKLPDGTASKELDPQAMLISINSKYNNAMIILINLINIDHLAIFDN